MPQYRAPLRDIRFVLHDLLEIDKHYASLPGAEELDLPAVDAILGEVARLSETIVAPLNRPGDEHGCSWSEAGVRTPPGFKQAYEQYYAAGLANVAGDVDYGGQGLPESLALVCSEIVGAANNSFCTYTNLTNAAMTCIRAHGTPEQCQTYLPSMIAGKWSGTMCLTEAQCGTDLGLVRTSAVPKSDGSYSITGEKIFITGGDQDLTENIVHLVLARLPDAPPGTKGISLFIVPKLLPSGHGVGAPNGVRCAAIERKMGIKGSATCTMVFEEATGVLIGKPHQGLRCMFTMMNVARLGTGIQGFAQGEASFQGALAYARERLQMRALTGPKAPDRPADPIIVHADVRRMLLTQKALIEGARALSFYCGTLVDVSLRRGKQEAEHAAALLQLLTPICKAFMTDTAYEVTNLGMQVFGGHGYIREHGMEQLVRDGRVFQLYEGANGIQALDLLGRKVLMTGGAGLRLFTEQIEAFCGGHAGEPGLEEFLTELAPLLREWHTLVERILPRALQAPDEVGAAAYDFLTYSGYVAFAFFHARMAAVSLHKLETGAPDSDFYRAKLHTARFFYQRLLPRTRALVPSMLSGADNLMTLSDSHFAF